MYRNQRGFSLIELMIALVIGLFMSLATVSIAKQFGLVRTKMGVSTIADANRNIGVQQLVEDAARAGTGVVSASGNYQCGVPSAHEYNATTKVVTFNYFTDLRAATPIPVTSGAVLKEIAGLIPADTIVTAEVGGVCSSYKVASVNSATGAFSLKHLSTGGAGAIPNPSSISALYLGTRVSSSWRVMGSGLERSLDGGTTWVAVAPTVVAMQVAAPTSQARMLDLAILDASPKNCGTYDMATDKDAVKPGDNHDGKFNLPGGEVDVTATAQWYCRTYTPIVVRVPLRSYVWASTT